MRKFIKLGCVLLLLGVVFAAPGARGQTPAEETRHYLDDPFGEVTFGPEEIPTYGKMLDQPFTISHPLKYLQYVYGGHPEEAEASFEYFFKETGIKGHQAQLLERMGRTFYRWSELLGYRYQNKERLSELASLTKELRTMGNQFMKTATVLERLRVYKVAEKFKAARSFVLALVDQGVYTIPEVKAGTKADWAYKDERSYLYGMERGYDPLSCQKIEQDFKRTMEYLMSLEVPGKLKTKEDQDEYRDGKRHYRAGALKKLKLFEF